ncbi:MAG: stage II sporulation protein R [Clostridia bacterium]|nr:stage II sporulation protein R [Clostridia bacterium]
MEKKAFSVLLIAVTLTLIIGILPVHGERQIYDSVVRLHVLANSDSEEDQALKLHVRDRILSLTESLLSEAGTRDEAAKIINKNLILFEECALSALREKGSEYGVSVSMGKEQYPTREYQSAAFPGGEYLSLQIKIGSAEGKNWWCVLFPPICLSAASGDKDEGLEGAFIAAGLTPDQYKIITETDESAGKYRIRFKILEIFEEIAGLFK